MNGVILIKAVLLDFYGTLVEEDDLYISKICNDIVSNSSNEVLPSEVGKYWYKQFSVQSLQPKSTF